MMIVCLTKATSGTMILQLGDSLHAKINQVRLNPFGRRQFVWEKYSIALYPPEKEASCLGKKFVHQVCFRFNC